MLSRFAVNPIDIPNDVEVNIDGYTITAVGKLGTLSCIISSVLLCKKVDNQLMLAVNPDSSAKSKEVKCLSGTFHSLIRNLLFGVSKGYTKKLLLFGVGNRASLKNDVLSLSVGYSHPVVYTAPDGITLVVPSPTEIVVSGCDKQLVGQVSANIRSFRPVECYKGKGIRYEDEVVILKEAKKK